MTTRTSASSIVLEALPGSFALPEELTAVPDVQSRREEKLFRQRKSLFNRWRELSLFNQHYIELRLPSENGRSRVLNLAYLAHEPEVADAGGWHWLLIILLICGGAMTALFYGLWLVAAMSGMIAVPAFVFFSARAQKRVLFKTKYGGVMLFDVYLGFWHRREAEKFITLIRQRIAQSSSLLPRGERRLALEVAEHRRLAEDGWLSRARYEQAKKRIFRRYKRQKKGADSYS